MSTMSDRDLQLQEIQAAMRDPNWAQWINSLLSETDSLLAAANHPSARFLGRAEMLAELGLDERDVAMIVRIATRLQLVVSNIECRDPPQTKKFVGRTVMPSPKAKAQVVRP